MKVYIVGAGAVGRWLGQAFQSAGNEIVFAPRAYDEVTPVEADLVIVAVKAYDTAGAIETLRRALSAASRATILTVQNGIGNEELLADAFGSDAVVAGALTVPVELRPDGSVQAANGGGIGLAPVGRQAHNWLIAACAAAKVPCQVVRDYRALKWSKLTLNILANASCAILDMMPEAIVRNAQLFAAELQAVREVAAIFSAKGIEPVDLPRYPVRALLLASRFPATLMRPLLAPRIVKSRGGKTPSLLLDVAARKRNEVAALNGAVAREAVHLGVSAPVNTAYAHILETISASPEKWQKFRGMPQALLASIAK